MSNSFESGSSFLLSNEPDFSNGQHGEWRDSPCHNSLLYSSPQAGNLARVTMKKSIQKANAILLSAHVNINDL